MEVKVYGPDGKETGRTVSLDPAVFDIEPNDHAIWLDVRAIQANGRQGTHKAKERSEVAGSTRKLYRQKGTGHARAGSAKSPVRKSGGTIFGPRPRDYGLKMNRKTKRLARRSALTYKARAEALRVVEGITMEAPSTRQLRELLASLDLGGRKVLLLTEESQGALHRSSRNLAGVQVRKATAASTLELLDAQIIVLQEGALEALSALLGKPAPAAAE